MISPVRNITPADKDRIEKYVKKLESQGKTVHWPLRDTEQNDPSGGTTILKVARKAIEECVEVHIWWAPYSQGSLFDLGTAWALRKPLVIANPEDIVRTEGKSFANVILDWADSDNRLKYVIFDLEATCWKNNFQRKQPEIIEIGAVMLDCNLTEIGTFSKFVRPVINPKLSEFCTELTTISQADVDSAKSFAEVMKLFEEWTSGREVLFLSWGQYDKNQIIREARLKKYSGKIEYLLKNHFNLKQKYAEITDEPPCGMARALHQLQLPLKGTHHRGIDDAKNIARIFRRIHGEIQF